MLTTILLAAIVILVGIAILAYIRQEFAKLAKPEQDPTMLEWVKSTQEDLKALRETLHETSSKSDQRITSSLQQHTKDIHDRLTRAAEVIGELKREAGAFSEISRSMKDLHEFLRSPKLRGNIGEQVLNDLIGQMLPKQSFHLQHKFRSGVIVDAALKTDAGILPIDSKFPMENFQAMMKRETEKERELARKEFMRDVKKHIDAISTKYILPEEGTMDFALMYVPSEAIFYEIVNDISTMEYAKTKRVYVVSPNTLYVHLQTILLANEGKKIESKTREVFRMLHAAQGDYVKLGDQLEKLGKHLTNAYNNLGSVSGVMQQLGSKLETSRMLGEQESPESLPEKI
jgi:DNA recombination protein RmuC